MPTPRIRRFTNAQAKRIGDRIGVNWTRIPLSEFRRGLVVELEHGRRDRQTDITHDNLVMTGKIAWAHLKEHPKYYTRLRKVESRSLVSKGEKKTRRDPSKWKVLLIRNRKMGNAEWTHDTRASAYRRADSLSELHGQSPARQRVEGQTIVVDASSYYLPKSVQSLRKEYKRIEGERPYANEWLVFADMLAIEGFVRQARQLIYQTRRWQRRNRSQSAWKRTHPNYVNSWWRLQWDIRQRIGLDEQSFRGIIP